MRVCGSKWLLSPRQMWGMLEVIPLCSCHLCFRAGLGQGQVDFPGSSSPRLLFPAKFSNQFGPWERFCSALGGPGWTVSPQKGACEGCRYHMPHDGCWPSQHPVPPYPRSLCNCPWLRCRRNTRCFLLVPWHTCTTVLALGAPWVQLSGCPSR